MLHFFFHIYTSAEGHGELGSKKTQVKFSFYTGANACVWSDHLCKLLFNNLNATEHCLLTLHSGIHLMNFILLLPKSHFPEILFNWSRCSLRTRILQALQMILTWEKGDNYWQRAVILKPYCASVTWMDCYKCCTQFDWVGLGWSPRIYFSNKFPNDAELLFRDHTLRAMASEKYHWQ